MGRWVWSHRVGAASRPAWLCATVDRRSAQPISRRHSRPQTTFRSSVEVTSLDVTVVDDRGKPIVESDAGRFRRAHRRQRAQGRDRGMGAARHRVDRQGGAAAARGLQHERIVDRRPADRHRRSTNRTSASAVRSAIAQGGECLRRSALSLGSDCGRRFRVRRTGDGIHRRSRSRQDARSSRMTGRNSRPLIDIGHVNVSLSKSQADRARRSDDARTGHGSRVPGLIASSELRWQCRQRGRDRSARRWRRTRHLDARSDASHAARSVRRAEPDRRTQDADSDLRRVRPVRPRRWIFELGAMAAQARTSVYALKLDTPLFDITDAAMPIDPFGDRQRAQRRSRHAGRRARAARCSR